MSSSSGIDILNGSSCDAIVNDEGCDENTRRELGILAFMMLHGPMIVPPHVRIGRNSCVPNRKRRQGREFVLSLDPR